MQNKHHIVIGALAIIISVAVGLFVYLKDAEAPVALVETQETPADTEGNTQTPPEDTAEKPTEARTETPKTITPAPAPTTPTPKPKPTSTPTPKVAYHAFIRYEDNGFSPVRVTIKKGQTVRFYNDSEREMWVASNIHPTHNNYIEKSEKDCIGSSFDQCVAVGKGKYWDFTFNHEGSWEFHNHMRARDDGVVYVEKPE